MCAQKSPLTGAFLFQTSKKEDRFGLRSTSAIHFFRDKMRRHVALHARKEPYSAQRFMYFSSQPNQSLGEKNAQKGPPKCYSSLPFTEYWLTLAQKSSPRPIRRLNGGYFTGKPLKWLPLSGAAPFPKVSCFRLSCIVALMRGRSSTKWPNGQYLSRARPTSASRTAY